MAFGVISVRLDGESQGSSLIPQQIWKEWQDWSEKGVGPHDVAVEPLANPFAMSIISDLRVILDGSSGMGTVDVRVRLS